MIFSLDCRLVIVCKIHIFFVEWMLLFIVNLHPSISCFCSFLYRHPCCWQEFQNCHFLILLYAELELVNLDLNFKTKSLSLSFYKNVMNSEKYMNSKKVFSLYHFFLTCFPRCITLIVLALLCLQDTIN